MFKPWSYLYGIVNGKMHDSMSTAEPKLICVLHIDQYLGYLVPLSRSNPQHRPFLSYHFYSFPPKSKPPSQSVNKPLSILS